MHPKTEPPLPSIRWARFVLCLSLLAGFGALMAAMLVEKETHLRLRGQLVEAERILVHLPPHHWANIQQNQPATIGFDAFPSTHFGQADAVIEQMDSAMNAQGHYRAFLRIISQTGRLTERQAPLGSGVDVTIKTGRKRVITWLMKPLTRAFEEGMHEQ